MPAAIPIIATILVKTAIAVGVALLSTGIGQLTSKIFYGGGNKSARQRMSADRRNREQAISTVNNIPVIYGKCRVGGNKVFAETKLAYTGTEIIRSNGQDILSDKKGDYLYLATVFAEGEIDSIEKLLLDNIDSESSIFNSHYQVDLQLAWDFDATTAPDYAVSQQLGNNLLSNNQPFFPYK